MPLVLCRVDDRLVHGQVVIGWGRSLAIHLVVLVDDGVRQSEWEQSLYRMAIPQGVDIVFASTAEAVTQLRGWAEDTRKGILLTGEIATMAALRDAAPDVVRRINLGGLHHRPQRRECLRYVYLDPAEEALLKRLSADGALIEAQDLPTSPPIGLAELLA
jgi:mannose/fructose/N-acetylgalactosamine-specific phosphotransferase system component IIB